MYVSQYTGAFHVVVFWNLLFILTVHLTTIQWSSMSCASTSDGGHQRNCTIDCDYFDFRTWRVESLPEKRDWYDEWYFWVIIGCAFVMAVVVTSVCVLKCQRLASSNHDRATAICNGLNLYRAVQDSSGIIRPMVACKNEEDAISSDINNDDNVLPLKPPYEPLLIHTGSIPIRFNDDQLANIILPPGFIPQCQMLGRTSPAPDTS